MYACSCVRTCAHCIPISNYANKKFHTGKWRGSVFGMPKGRQGKGHGNRDSAVAKKRDRVVKEALRKERKSGACLDPADPDFRSFTNQLQAQGLKLVDVPGDG